MKGKQGNMAAPVLVISVVVIAGLLAYAILGGGESLSFTSEKTSDGKPLLCDSTTTPNLTIKAYDQDNVGTSLTEATNLYRIVGEKTWSTFTQGTGFAVSPGDQIEYVVGITTSDFTDNAYGPHVKSFTVPCEETPSIEHALAQDEIETSLAATFYNADGDAGAETFAADQSQTISLKLLAGSDEYFGNPNLPEKYPNVVCLDLNSTAWDKPEWVKFDGATMNQVSIPQRHTGSTTDNTYCYQAPVIDDALMESDRYQVRLNADASNAPTVDDTAYIYAANWFINTETGDVEWGVEDNEGNAVGTDASDSVTLDFTA